MWWKIILITLSSIIFLAASSVTIGNIIFKRNVNGEVADLFKKSKESKPEIITEEDIQGLPEPVKRYLTYAGVMGKEKIKAVRLKQIGYLRQKPDQPWMPLEAEQYFTTDPPAFLWTASAKAFPLISIKARDMYFEGKGNMYVKLPPFITIADARGQEIDQGSLLRYLAEMVWFPTAYLSEYIRWEPLDSNSARIVMNYQGITLPATVFFNEKGEMTRLVARRYAEMDGSYSLEDWAPVMSEYREFNGIRIPTKVEYDNPSLAK